MGVIRIVDLKVRAIIGAHAWERVKRQDLVLNITLEYDASKAAKSDRLTDALDYEAVTVRVMKAVERSKDHLLEKLASRILDVVMADKKVASAYVRIDKPQAIPDARCVSFELARQR